MTAGSDARINEIERGFSKVMEAEQHALSALIENPLAVRSVVGGRTLTEPPDNVDAFVSVGIGSSLEVLRGDACELDFMGLSRSRGEGHEHVSDAACFFDCDFKLDADTRKAVGFAVFSQPFRDHALSMAMRSALGVRLKTSAAWSTRAMCEVRTNAQSRANQQRASAVFELTN